MVVPGEVRMDLTLPPAPHKRTRLIAKDADAEYIECLDLYKAILESSESCDDTIR